MNRLQFLKRLGLGITAVVMAPDLLVASPDKEVIKPINRQWATGAIRSETCVSYPSYKIRVENITNQDIHNIVIFDVWEKGFMRPNIRGIKIDMAPEPFNPGINFVGLMHKINAQPFVLDSLGLNTNKSEQFFNNIHLVSKRARNGFIEDNNLTKPLHLSNFMKCTDEDNKCIHISNVNFIMDGGSSIKILSLKAHTYLDIEMIERPVELQTTLPKPINF